MMYISSKNKRLSFQPSSLSSHTTSTSVSITQFSPLKQLQNNINIRIDNNSPSKIQDQELLNKKRLVSSIAISPSQSSLSYEVSKPRLNENSNLKAVHGLEGGGEGESCNRENINITADCENDYNTREQCAVGNSYGNKRASVKCKDDLILSIADENDEVGGERLGHVAKHHRKGSTRSRRETLSPSSTKAFLLENDLEIQDDYITDKAHDVESIESIESIAPNSSLIEVALDLGVGTSMDVEVLMDDSKHPLNPPSISELSTTSNEGELLSASSCRYEDIKDPIVLEEDKDIYSQGHSVETQEIREYITVVDVVLQENGVTIAEVDTETPSALLLDIYPVGKLPSSFQSESNITTKEEYSNVMHVEQHAPLAPPPKQCSSGPSRASGRTQQGAGVMIKGLNTSMLGVNRSNQLVSMMTDTTTGTDVDDSAELELAAYRRFLVRNEIAKWKFAWELTSIEAAKVARNLLRNT